LWSSPPPSVGRFTASTSRPALRSSSSWSCSWWERQHSARWGLALTCAIPNADSAPAVTLGTVLPLSFLSGIFIPFNNSTPSWLLWVARVFPVMHFAKGMFASFVGTPFDWVDVLVVAAWGVAGLLLAIRFFSWEPRTK